MIALQGCGVEVVGSEACPLCSTSSQEAPISSADGGGLAIVSQGEAAACAAWQSVHDRQTQTATWTAGAAQCDQGSLPSRRDRPRSSG